MLGPDDHDQSQDERQWVTFLLPVVIVAPNHSSARVMSTQTAGTLIVQLDIGSQSSPSYAPLSCYLRLGRCPPSSEAESWDVIVFGLGMLDPSV